MAAAKDEKEKDKLKSDGVITAVYKVNLHCPQCASEIKKPLLRTQGVHSVETEMEKGEIKVKGVIDAIKIHKMIEKLTKKKVELVSPKINIAEKEKEKAAAAAAAAAAQKKKNETKEQILRTTSMKVHLHCDKCEEDLRKKLLKHKGIFSVKSDMKAQTLTVQGTIEPDKLSSYIRKKVHKHVEIISSKTEKKEEKKENPKAEAKKEEKKDNPKAEAKKEEKKDNPKAEAKKDDLKGGAQSGEKMEVIEFKQEVKVEAKSKEGNAPYFIHYVYAPQLFSDENPNACSIM
ncbi:hypothetical protein PTKIN_Ptkin09bG0208200 [Pterospermum kingtungense]